MISFKTSNDRLLPHSDRKILTKKPDRMGMGFKGHFNLDYKKRAIYDDVDLWKLAHTQKEYAGFLLYGKPEDQLLQEQAELLAQQQMQQEEEEEEKGYFSGNSDEEKEL